VPPIDLYSQDAQGQVAVRSTSSDAPGERQLLTPPAFWKLSKS